MYPVTNRLFFALFSIPDGMRDNAKTTNLHQFSVYTKPFSIKGSKNMSSAASTAVQMAAHRQRMVNAVRASGVIVQMEPDGFLDILRRAMDEDTPLVVTATAKSFFFKTTTYSYLTSYKGLIFYADSANPLVLPEPVELVLAESIWIPTV